MQTCLKNDELCVYVCLMCRLLSVQEQFKAVYQKVGELHFMCKMYVCNALLAVICVHHVSV